MRCFFFVVACLVLVSCFDKGDCLFTNTNVVKITFVDRLKPTQTKQVRVDTVFLPGDDKTRYTVINNLVASVALIVDPNATSTKYVFQHTDRVDTLVLSYTTRTIVLSPDCGSYNFQNDLTVEYSTFPYNYIVSDQHLLTSVTSNIEILL